MPEFLGCKISHDTGHAADFLLFSNLLLTKTTATESTKVGYVYGLTTTWTSCRSFAEKQKVGGVSGNPPCPETPSVTLVKELRQIFCFPSECLFIGQYSKLFLENVEVWGGVATFQESHCM